MHRAIADTPGRLLASVPTGRTAMRIHNGVRDGVYTSIRVTARTVFTVLDQALALAGPSVQPQRRLPSPVVGLIRGIVGDHIARSHNPLATDMHLRHHGGQLDLTPAALATALPDAGARPVVLVHGLAADETCWQRGSLKTWGQPGHDYGRLLAERHGFTPVYLRYNSGLRIADNGRALAKLLSQLVQAWPVPIHDLTLLGHSMGGLVVRSACHHGHADAMAWTPHVRNVICLGAPQRGAVLEKFGAVATKALATFNVTAPIGRVLDARSAGIKDLRNGTVCDDDRGEQHLPNARYHDLAGTLGRKGNPLGWVLGDGLVHPTSASPRTGPRASATRLADLGHLAMLNDPAVLAFIEAALHL